MLFCKTSHQSWLYLHHDICMPVQICSCISTDLKSLIPHLSLVLKSFLRLFAPKQLKFESKITILLYTLFSTLVSRKICEIFEQKVMTVNFTNFHTVHSVLSRYLGKNFVKTPFLLKLKKSLHYGILMLLFFCKNSVKSMFY